MTIIFPNAAPYIGSNNLSNQTHKTLTDMIRSRRLRGGDVIIESRLSSTLGVSRTPLREALQRLEGEGLVLKSANRSFIVRTVDLAEYLQSLKVREILESEAATWAVGKIDLESIKKVRADVIALGSGDMVIAEQHWQSDDDVHNLFIDACGNPVMANTIRLLRVTTRLFEIFKLSDRVRYDTSEHIAILDALASANVQKTRQVVRDHLHSLYRFGLENVS
jgi:DNA-binding GntR family transcriptional regulator